MVDKVTIRSTNPKKWKEHQIIKATKNNLLNHICENCEYYYRCKTQELVKKTYNTCCAWEKSASVFSKYIPIIRRTYPNLIAAELVSVQPISTSSSQVFYLKARYTTAPIKNIIKSKNKQKQILIEIKHQLIRFWKFMNRILRRKNGI